MAHDDAADRPAADPTRRVAGQPVSVAFSSDATDAEVAELVEQVRLTACAGASRHSSDKQAAPAPDEAS